MINNIVEQLIKYLDKNYIISDNTFFIKYEKNHIFGKNIVNDIEIIFDVSLDTANAVFIFWANCNGFNETHSNWKNAWGVLSKLKTRWSMEKLYDSRHFEDIEAEVILRYCDEVVTELGINPNLLNLIPKKIADFLSIMKCLGYGLSELTYDVNTFQAMKFFILLDYYEVKYERENNIYWQNWIRTREYN